MIKIISIKYCLAIFYADLKDLFSFKIKLASASYGFLKYLKDLSRTKKISVS